MHRHTFNGIKPPFLKNDNLYTISPVENTDENDYYFLSNDAVEVRLPRIYDRPITFIGIANPHCFHTLGLLSCAYAIERIIIIDCNIRQLHHFTTLAKTILKSDSRIAYLENLFKLTFNDEAIALLNTFSVPFWKSCSIHGSKKKSDGYGNLEKVLWENATFDHDAFYQAYGLDAERTGKGLCVRARTIGDFDTYYVSCIAASRSDYEYHPFNAGYGCGFLRDETSFHIVRRVLSETPISLIHEDIASVYESLLVTNTYSPLVVWLSNSISDYFVDKHNALQKIISVSETYGSNKEPHFPEIDINIIQDSREARKLSPMIANRKKKKRPLSVHSRSFQCVQQYMQGERCLEVVNVQRWIDRDDGMSKLPNTEYIHCDDFCKIADDAHYDSIFIHILLGHCLFRVKESPHAK